MDAGTIAILLQAKDEMTPVLEAASGAADGFGSRMGLVGAAVGLAVGGLAVAAVKGLADVGEAFDGAYDTIRVGTGATGEVLAGLQDDFKSVVSSVPTDFDTASAAIADLNTRLGLTGEPLQEMTTQFINLGRITGEEVPALVASGTRAFGDWSIATEDQSESLDHLFRVSQSTGIGVSELMDKVVQFGAPLRQMGFSFEEATALMGKWEKEGVNTELVLGSLRIAMGQFAKEGIPMREGLDQTIASIQELGPGAEATALAMEVFGARAGPDMAAAILEGRFAADELMASLAAGGDTINGVAAETDDWREKLQILKNKGLVALEPVANFVFGQINIAVDLLILAIGVLTGSLGGPLQAVFSALSGLIAPIVGGLSRLASVARTLGSYFSFIVTEGDPLNDHLSDLPGKIQPVVYVIGRLVAAARDLIAGWGNVVSALRNGDISGAFGELFGSYKTYLSTLLEIGTDVGGAVLDAILGVDWAGIARSGVDALIGAWDAITDFGGRVLDWAVEQITGVDWGGAASSAGEAVVDGLLAAIDTVTDFGSRIATWVGDEISAVDWAAEASDVGTAITDGAMTSIEAVTDWGTRFATWVSGQLSGVDWSGVATAVVSGITSGLTSAGTLGQSLVNAIGPSLQSADWAGPASGIVSGIGGALATMDFAGMWAGVTSSVSSVVTALEPLWTSISAAATTILPPLVSLWTTLSAQFATDTPLMQSLSTLWAQLVLTAQQLWAALVPLQPVLVAIGAVIGGIIVVAIGLLMGVLGGLVGMLSGVLPGAIQMVSGLITAMAGSIQVATAIVTGVLNIVIALLRGDWTGAWNAAKTMVQGVADGIRTIISGMVTAVTGAISGLVGGVTGMISGFVNAIIGFFQNLYDTLVGGSIVPDMVRDIISTIAGLPGEVLGIISGMVTEAIGFFTGLAADAVGAVTGLVTDSLSQFGTLATDGAAKAGELATNALSAITGFATDALTAVSTFVTDSIAKFVSLALDGATQARALAANVLTAATGMATDVLSAITGFVTDSITEFTTWVTNAATEVGRLPGEALSALGDLSSTLVSAGADLIGGFISGITSRIPDVQGALGGITSSLTDWKGPPATDAVILRPSGQLVMGGFIAGVRDRVPEVRETLSAVTDMIAAGLGADATADDIKAGWLSLLGDLDGIISGDVQGRLMQTLFGLEQQLAVALGEGAPQAVIDALRASIAETEASLNQVSTIFQQAVQQGMVDAYSPEMIANFGAELDGIINGTLVPQLQSSLDAANARVALATSLGWNQEIVDAYQAQADEIAEELAQAHSDTAAAAAAGLLSDEAQAALNEAMGVVTAIPLDEIRALIPRMEAGGTELIDSLVGAIADGRMAAEDAWSMLSDMSGEQVATMRDQLHTLEQQLTVQLAQAWLDGTDPSGIAANLQAIQDLLAQTADVATSTADTVDSALTSLNAPSSSGGGGGGGGGGGLSGASRNTDGIAGPGGSSGNIPPTTTPASSDGTLSATEEAHWTMVADIIAKRVGQEVRQSLVGA